MMKLKDMIRISPHIPSPGETAVKNLLQQLNYNIKDPNFIDTPKRVAKMWNAFRNVEKPTLTTFPLKTRGGMIILKNHISWGYCPHHLLPVKYTFRIGYIPEDRVLGLSKLARIADWILTTLPLQEEIAPEIIDTITKAINPKGSGCIINGEHMCTRIRGVSSPCAEAISDIMQGMFLTDKSTRNEFINI